MGRSIIRRLLNLPCRRRDHVWFHPGDVEAPDYFVCAVCAEPGFRV